MNSETYEVLFDDGYVKILKAHRMVKLNAKNMQSSPLFDPIRSTKQERRDKKRKLNVAALFGKRSRVEAGEDKGQGSPQRNEQYPAATTAAALYSSPTEELEYWTPRYFLKKNFLLANVLVSFSNQLLAGKTVDRLE